MGMFSSILAKLGLGKKPAVKPEKKEAARPSGGQPGALASAAPKPAVPVAKPAPAAAASPKPASVAPKPAAQGDGPKKASLSSKPAAAPKKTTLANTLGARAAEPAAGEPVEAPAPEPVAEPEPAAEPEVEAISVVDVVADLEARAAKHPEKLNWKVSIVDLLKLLGLESSFAARKELAEELECPADLMADSAKMNAWLHKTVLARIAENGGNIPQDLLD